MYRILNHLKYSLVISMIFTLLSCSFIYSSVFPQEVTYFEFNSHMLDYSTGYLELKITFTYVEDRDLVNIYYQSGNCKAALLLIKSSREKLLEYINKYEEWNKIALEKQVYLRKLIGNLNMGIYFKYANLWHNGGNIISKIHFLSIHKTRHQLIIQPIRAVSKQNRFLIFKPEILYFTYEDIQIFKQALQEDFIQREYNKKLSERKSIYDEFK